MLMRCISRLLSREKECIYLKSCCIYTWALSIFCFTDDNSINTFKLRVIVIEPSRRSACISLLFTDIHLCFSRGLLLLFHLKANPLRLTKGLLEKLKAALFHCSPAHWPQYFRMKALYSFSSPTPPTACVKLYQSEAYLCTHQTLLLLFFLCLAFILSPRYCQVSSPLCCRRQHLVSVTAPLHIWMLHFSKIYSYIITTLQP